MLKRWPIHPLINTNESLSSWIKRTSLSYNIDCRDLFNKISYQRIALLEFHAGDNLLEKIAKSTGILIENLQLATFDSYLSTLPTFQFNIKNKGISIIKEGINASSHLMMQFFTTYASKSYYERNKNTMRYCPVCLEEDVHPYFRLFWRLSYYFVCLKHNVLMKDRCDVCSSQIRFLEAKSIVQCFKCDHNLTQFPTIINIDEFAVHKFNKIFFTQKSPVRSIPARTFMGKIWTVYADNIRKTRFYLEQAKEIESVYYSLWFKFYAFDFMYKLFSKSLEKKILLFSNTRD